MVRRLLLVVVLALVACTPSATDEMSEVVAAESTTQPPDLVDLTVYYRHGRGERAYLTPVVHEVAVSEDLPRAALRLLLDGPSQDSDAAVMAPLPASTRILHFEIADQTATVDLSSDVVKDAGSVGIRSEHEYLALAAIANTLTEFPSISRVALRVGGRADSPFWGGWGLPQPLLRDEAVVDPREPGRGTVPNLDSFSGRPQGVGGRRQGVTVVSHVRARPHLGYLRLTIGLAAADGDDLVGPLPRAEVRRAGKRLRLDLDARATPAAIRDVASRLNDPAFRSARLHARRRDGGAVLSVTPAQRARFYLHTSDEPSRVILDIRR